MILVDTSVWIDHFRRTEARLAECLNRREVLSHPFVIGELALGNLRQRDVILDAMQDLPRADIATDEEVLRFIDQHKLSRRGIGYIDAHLLVSTRLMPNAVLWTRDKKLHGATARLALAARFD